MPPTGAPPERPLRALRGCPGENAPRGPDTLAAPRGPDMLAELGGMGSVVEGGRQGLYLIEAMPSCRRASGRDSW